MSIPARHGKSWSTQEIQQLLQEVRRNETHEQIASKHERTLGGIRSRLRELAADYYYNDNRPIEEIMKFTGLDAQTISDAIMKRKQRAVMVETKKETKQPKQEDTTMLLQEIRDMIKEILKILKK